MKQLNLSYVNPEIEKVRQEILDTQDILDEKPIGDRKTQNVNFLNEARRKIKEAEDANNMGSDISQHMEAIRLIIRKIMLNLK